MSLTLSGILAVTLMGWSPLSWAEEDPPMIPEEASTSAPDSPETAPIAIPETPEKPKEKSNDLETAEEKESGNAEDEGDTAKNQSSPESPPPLESKTPGAEAVSQPPELEPAPPSPPPAASVETLPPASDPAPPPPVQNTAEFRRKKKYPAYQLKRPGFGIEIAMSPKALGDGIEFNSVRPLGIQFDFQPTFIQSIGVIGIGPSLEIYPISAPAPGLVKTPASWAAGGQVRYQFRIFREQVLVPMAGYSLHYLKYKLSSNTQGAMNLNTALFGAYILLNVFEPSAAHEMYMNTGITRSYLVAELRQMTGEDENAALSSSSYYFGLRFEF